VETAETAIRPVEDTTTELEEIIQAVENRIEINGIECEVGRLRTREFFSLLRILTRGMGSGIATLFDPEASAQDNAGRFLGALIVSVPEAETDFILLVKKLVKPIDPDKAEEVKAALDNPGLDVMLEIAQIVALQEAGELTRLGKAAKSWWEANKDRMKVAAESH